ncbi:MAG: GNAT family N-acetyltransferase [Nitrospira sp.]|nr:GNAT family N-acetyltransferase [Nitrospira sp.]
MTFTVAVGKVDEEITLQDLAHIDADELFTLVDRNRAYLRQWLPWLDLTQTADDSRALFRRQQTKADEGLSMLYGIEYRDELCGIAGFRGIDAVNRNCEIAYWVSEDRQGRGIVTRCVQALITYAFTTRELIRVTIPVAVDNHKSRAIPERLGFAREGILREAVWLYDHAVDVVLYALLRKD